MVNITAEKQTFLRISVDTLIIEVFLLLLNSPSHCPYPSIVPIHVFQVCTYAAKNPTKVQNPYFLSCERRTVQIIIVIYGTAKEFGASRS